MRIVIVSAGIEAPYLRIQPNRTLIEMGRQLAIQGHHVVLLSSGPLDAAPRDHVGGVPLRRVPSVSLPHGRGSRHVFEALAQETPDLVFWHLSLMSFLHQSLRFALDQPVIGIVTSPIHRPAEILRLGPRKIASNVDLIAVHLAGSLAPGWTIRQAVAAGSGLCGLVTLSKTTRRYLIGKGIRSGQVWVVPPGVDQAWLHGGAGPVERQRTRLELGFDSGDVVVTYFGSPAPVRGVETMLDAVEKVAETHPQVKLLMLSRRWDHEWRSQTSRLQGQSANGHHDFIRFIDGYLSQQDLIRYVDASHLVCLPFELLPSDVPLSVLESMALGRGVVTTPIACIPELVGTDRAFLVPPASAEALAEKIRWLVDRPELVEEQGRRAQTYVSVQRTWGAMGAALKQVIAAVTDGQDR